MMKSGKLWWAGTGEARNAYRILVVKNFGKKLPEAPRRKWEVAGSAWRSCAIVAFKSNKHLYLDIHNNLVKISVV
jgi:hypothetical protein